MEKFIAKVACPELDREIMENPPTVHQWFHCLTDKWQVTFVDSFNSLLSIYEQVPTPSYSSFGMLIEDLLKENIAPPPNFIEHISRSHNYRYLIKKDILDELKLASLIGTTPERAAELNGAVTTEEKKYYTDMTMELPMPPTAEEAQKAALDSLKRLKKASEEGDPIRKQVNEINEMINNKPDPLVHHPKHYTKGDIECIDAIAGAITGLVEMEAVCTANVIKYMWRWKEKNGVQDLEKAKWYLEKLISELKK